MEIFDVLDCRGLKNGEVIPREEAHRAGVWHGAFHCLVIGERDGRRYAIFQKRSLAKKIAPGKFDVSVGGHYTAGEDAKAAGPREIREELGLDVSFNELVPLGRRVFVYCFTPGVKECEFQDIFLLPRDVRPGGLALQADELDGVIEVELEQGIALFAGVTAQVEIMLHKPDGCSEETAVKAGDFVPCLDNYYLKLLMLAKRYFQGERELLLI
ncbi:MAG TPA: NUDIX domain-containing protein [Nitrospirota bacterium]|nr:NUDIX domain-containing protein [Nitrospirota bacterium]